MIKKQLDLIFPLTRITWEALCEIGEEKMIRKNQNLATQGEHFNYEVFVVEGVLRSFHITDEGKEYSASFYREGNFVMPAFARQSNGKSILNIQALELSKVVVFDEKKFTALRHGYEDLFMLGSIVSERELLTKSLKEVLLATGNLKELYLFFQDRYPNFQSRISQRHIASYMGVDPVSLSRVKAKLLKEEKGIG
ncbi:MAG: Crp/Fnr family transcriptional regulator [Bacteroidota bacterium]